MKESKFLLIMYCDCGAIHYSNIPEETVGGIVQGTNSITQILTESQNAKFDAFVATHGKHGRQVFGGIAELFNVSDDQNMEIN